MDQNKAPSFNFASMALELASHENSQGSCDCNCDCDDGNTDNY